MIRAIDGPLALTPCTSRTAYRRCEDCIGEATCAIRNTLEQVRDNTAQILEGTTLAEAAWREGEAGAEADGKAVSEA